MGSSPCDRFPPPSLVSATVSALLAYPVGKKRPWFGRGRIPRVQEEKSRGEAVSVAALLAPGRRVSPCKAGPGMCLGQMWP